MAFSAFRKFVADKVIASPYLRHQPEQFNGTVLAMIDGAPEVLVEFTIGLSGRMPAPATKSLYPRRPPAEDLVRTRITIPKVKQETGLTINGRKTKQM